MKIRFAMIVALVLVSANLCSAQNTPKETGTAFAKALVSGDMATVKSLTTGSDADMKIIEAVSQMMVAMTGFQKAAVEKFGDAAKGMMGGDPAEQVSKSFTEAEEKIEGDVATLTPPGKEAPVKMKKVDGKWKIDLSSMPDREKMNVEQINTMTTVAKDVTKDLTGGKFTTLKEAQDAFGMRMMAIMMEAAQKQQGGAGGAGAATRPTLTPPAPPATPPAGKF